MKSKEYKCVKKFFSKPLTAADINTAITIMEEKKLIEN
jgi:hypothetical protein